MSFHLLACQTLTQADRLSMLTAATETVIPVAAFFPANALPSADSSSTRASSALIEWDLRAFMNTSTGTGGANTDTCTFRLYAGATPLDTATATNMWPNNPPTFVIDRTAGTLQSVALNISAVIQRVPSTALYAYTKVTCDVSPNSTVDSGARQRWSWNPLTQSDSLFGLRDGPFYMWLTTQWNANLAVSGFFDAKSTVVRAYGLNIPE